MLYVNEYFGKKLRQSEKTGTKLAREGVIIECPLNDLFHDRRDVIVT